MSPHNRYVPSSGNKKQPDTDDQASSQHTEQPQTTCVITVSPPSSPVPQDNSPHTSHSHRNTPIHPSPALTLYSVNDVSSASVTSTPASTATATATPTPTPTPFPISFPHTLLSRCTIPRHPPPALTTYTVNDVSLAPTTSTASAIPSPTPLLTPTPFPPPTPTPSPTPTLPFSLSPLRITPLNPDAPPFYPSRDLNPDAPIFLPNIPFGYDGHGPHFALASYPTGACITQLGSFDSPTYIFPSTFNDNSTTFALHPVSNGNFVGFHVRPYNAQTVMALNSSPESTPVTYPQPRVSPQSMASNTTASAFNSLVMPVPQPLVIPQDIASNNSSFNPHGTKFDQSSSFNPQFPACIEFSSLFPQDVASFHSTSINPQDTLFTQATAMPSPNIILGQASINPRSVTFNPATANIPQDMLFGQASGPYSQNMLYHQPFALNPQDSPISQAFSTSFHEAAYVPDPNDLAHNFYSSQCF